MSLPVLNVTFEPNVTLLTDAVGKGQIEEAIRLCMTGQICFHEISHL